MPIDGEAAEQRRGDRVVGTPDGTRRQHLTLHTRRVQGVEGGDRTVAIRQDEDAGEMAEAILGCITLQVAVQARLAA